MRQQNARVSILRVGRELLQSDLGGSNRLYESHRWTGSHRRPKQIGGGGGGANRILDSFVSGSFAPVLFAALAGWLVRLCPYTVYSTCCRLLCGFAPILFTVLAVWLCPCAVYSACCVALHLSGVQRLLRGLCGFAPILFTELAVAAVACCVALTLSCLQCLLCGFAPVLFTALAGWLCPYPVYSAC